MKCWRYNAHRCIMIFRERRHVTRCPYRRCDGFGSLTLVSNRSGIKSRFYFGKNCSQLFCAYANGSQIFIQTRLGEANQALPPSYAPRCTSRDEFPYRSMCAQFLTSRNKQYAHGKFILFFKRQFFQYCQFLNVNATLNASITVEEILKILRGLKNCKTSGVDDIINEYIKNKRQMILCQFMYFFNIIHV